MGGDGIVVQTAKGALVEHHRVDGFDMRSAGCNAGVRAWNSDDVLYRYDEVSGGHGTLESMAYGIDGGNTGTSTRTTAATTTKAASCWSAAGAA
ncbi:hypothetical protein [Streptomyces sp. NPDC096153]|uniref:hypothetical protein n=1 Tax=Streptomyces sp. NPDC096153 TaxID=3155548 RepID=UPI003317E7C4